MKIIDCHSHIFPDAIAPRAVENLEGHYEMPWGRLGTLDDMNDSLSGTDVVKSVIFGTPTKPSQVINTNNFLADLNGGKFISFGSVHPDYEDYLGEIDRAKELGMKGFKFHPDFQRFNVDDEKAIKIYERIGKDYPIMLHIGDKKFDFSNPKRLKRVMDIFPGHTFIAAHLGCYGVWNTEDDVLLGTNCYIDTSSSIDFLPNEESVRRIRTHGVDKVIFGTDFPAISHKDEIDKFMELDLTNEERKKILYKNAAKLLKLEEE